MMKCDDTLAREWESILTDMIYNNSEVECDEDDDAIVEDEVEIETFEQAGLCTRDNGIVIYMDGKEIRLTIQAYSR